MCTCFTKPCRPDATAHHAKRCKWNCHQMEQHQQEKAPCLNRKRDVKADEVNAEQINKLIGKVEVKKTKAGAIIRNIKENDW